MGWPRREPESPRVVEGVTKEEFEQVMTEMKADVAKIEALLAAGKELERKLRTSIDDARRAKQELESSIAASRRHGRGGW